MRAEELSCLVQTARKFLLANVTETSGDQMVTYTGTAANHRARQHGRTVVGLRAAKPALPAMWHADSIAQARQTPAQPSGVRSARGSAAYVQDDKQLSVVGKGESRSLAVLVMTNQGAAGSWAAGDDNSRKQQVLRLRRRSAACAQDDIKTVVSVGCELSVKCKSRSLAAQRMTPLPARADPSLRS